MPDNEFRLSGKQVEEIKSELIKYKEEIEASDNYLNLSTCMCSGLTMKVIKMFVQHFKNSVLLTELWKTHYQEYVCETSCEKHVKNVLFSHVFRTLFTCM